MSRCQDGGLTLMVVIVDEVGGLHVLVSRIEG